MKVENLMGWRGGGMKMGVDWRPEAKLGASPSPFPPLFPQRTICLCVSTKSQHFHFQHLCEPFSVACVRGLDFLVYLFLPFWYLSVPKVIWTE